MNKYIAHPDIAAVLEGRTQLPTITLWNRLEGRPRTHDFDRALKAEVRDPLWMLARQWQMGEFRGEDAGSPVLAKVHLETTRLTKFRAGSGEAEAFDDGVPLEAKVEHRPIPFEMASGPMALDLRLALGRRWLKLIDGIEAGLAGKFVAAFGVAAPDPTLRSDAPIAAHLEAAQAFAAVAGRAMDGWALYKHLTGPPAAHAHSAVTLADAANTGAIEAAEEEFLAWYEAIFYQPGPGSESAWLPQRLEYAFAASAPEHGGEKQLVAEEYYHGHLDWHNLDVERDGAGLGEVAGAPSPAEAQATATNSFIPTPITFDGMPNTRWWTFEQGRTNFGAIDPDTTEINKLLLMEFGLVYANDWFLLPVTVPAGSIVRVAGLMVTNTFGERFMVEAAGRGADQDWQRWSMFTLATRGTEDVAADTSLVVVPAAAKIQQGEPCEEVQLIRDEMANMVWGIESRIVLPSGNSRSGRSAALETVRYHRRLIEALAGAGPAPAATLPNEAAIRYQLMTELPENWIPFIPVHVANDTRQVQLRRAAILRAIDGDPAAPARIEPRTDLMRPGLGDPGGATGYDIHEEEVPRAGVRVSQGFRRTRWYDGQVFTWFGAHKEAGRGEALSRLGFDQIPVKPPKEPG